MPPEWERETDFLRPRRDKTKEMVKLAEASSEEEDEVQEVEKEVRADDGTDDDEEKEAKEEKPPEEVKEFEDEESMWCVARHTCIALARLDISLA